MSTTARKLRKRERHEALNTQAAFGAAAQVAIPAPYQHKARKATPVAERIENQPRQIFGRGFGGGAKPTRYGYTVPVLRRLAAVGVLVGRNAPDPTKKNAKRSPKSKRTVVTAPAAD